MEPLEKAIAMISAASGADASSVAERLNTDVTPDALASELFEPKYKAQRDQGHKIGTDKTFRKIEQALKAAGVDEVTLDTLPSALESLQSKSVNDSAKDLSPEQLLKLKPVVDALNAERLNTQKAVDAAVAKTKADLSDQQAAFVKQRTEAAVRSAVEAEITTLDPNFIAGKEAAQKKRLVDEILREGRFQLDDNGGILLTDEDGAVLPGKLGNGVATLADFVRDRAEEAYGLPVSGQRDTAGLTQEQIAAGQGKRALQHFKGDLPKTQDEYLKLANDPGLSLAAKKELKGAVPELSGG